MNGRASRATALAFFLAMAACGDSGEDSTGPDPPADSTAVSTCVSCHSDYEKLQQVYTPDSIIPSGGCSGPPPYYEPYDRVYLDPAGYALFEASSHGELECTDCHGGVEGATEKAAAHAGDFARFPSFQALEGCSECHAETVGTFENSLHYNGWGQKRAQILRAGVGDFESLHEQVKIGYGQNCATCHASCGSCHVNRPPAMGGGLLNGHDFQPPDMRDNCTACHSSRGGHAYYGEGIGTKPDVHLTGAGFTCVDCHSTAELHGGDGTVYEHRYQVQELPQCTDCHSDVASSNTYHMVHLDDLSCHTCHSQDYNQCGNCHVGGEGARIHSHQAYKIGRNPLVERPFEFSIVRRTLAAPDNWSEYGVEDFPMESFDDKALYNYTTPHSILRWTRRTEVVDGASCSSNCHIWWDGETYRNRNIYLFSDDLLTDWERQAAAAVVMDGHIPASWGVGDMALSPPEEK